MNDLFIFSIFIDSNKFFILFILVNLLYKLIEKHYIIVEI